MLISTLSELKQIAIPELAPRLRPSGVLMCSPEYFQVEDIKNPFMEGNVGKTDKSAAKTQWEELKKVYQASPRELEILPGAPDREDMVFSANFGICWQEQGQSEKHFLASRMTHPSRQMEIPHAIAWFRKHGYQIHELPEMPGLIYEGNGDSVWHPDKMLLWGGYGQRSTSKAYEVMSQQLGFPIILLKLTSKNLYHLDTAFSVLDEKTVLYCPEGFDDDGNSMIESMFPQRVTISMEQGRKYMTGNSFSIGNGEVVMQQGDTKLVSDLKSLGFHPVEVNLSEYVKSGGNTTCLKLDIY